MSSLKVVDQVRIEANHQLNPARKIELGQFMTPTTVAQFMASLFSERKGPVRLLDAGAGVGSLTDAYLHRWGNKSSSVSAYEIDPKLGIYLRETLRSHKGDGFEATVIERDFIQDSVYRIKLGKKVPGFTHAILNPPYKKINSNSTHRALLRAIGLETVNLYTAFLGLAIELMSEGGEIVAIIPRSFCNGLYYKPFRKWVLDKTNIELIHLFHSRTSAFGHDEVLQENVIIKLVRAKKQGAVTITTSSDTTFSDLKSHEYPFAEIVDPDDAQQFIHIPLAPTQNGIDGEPRARRFLGEISLEVSTGPVVDFRLKKFLCEEPSAGTVPLLYPGHFVNGAMEWPRQSKKPNALVSNAETKKWLFPSGFYVVARRLTSKEERRRIVAHVVDPRALQADSIAFENHLNVFHSRKKGLQQDVAYGLCAYLNSTALDDYFRRFSGHTQVNATDLRRLRYPELQELEGLGRWAQAQERLTQEMIDQQIKALDGQKRKQAR
jgi:adenine-specific DNA-methyltransferase